MKEWDDVLGSGKSVYDPHNSQRKYINSIAESCGKYQKNLKYSISSALVSDFIHLEFCLFAYRSGSRTRGSTKGQPPCSPITNSRESGPEESKC